MGLTLRRQRYVASVVSLTDEDFLSIELDIYFLYISITLNICVRGRR